MAELRKATKSAAKAGGGTSEDAKMDEGEGSAARSGDSSSARREHLREVITLPAKSAKPGDQLLADS